MNKLTAHRYGDMRSGKRRVCAKCGNKKAIESFVENGNNYDNPVCCGCRFVAPRGILKSDKRGKFRRAYRRNGIPIREDKQS